MGPFQQVMQTFTLKNLPPLDTAVLAALELFSEQQIPPISIPYRRPLVIGSGNAAATGRIIFEKQDAVFGDESTAERILSSIPGIDGVVLLSASGGKHAPAIAQLARKEGKQVTLLTNNSSAPAREFSTATFLFPKNREPYTYNTSTYLGMILGATKENPQSIKAFIEGTITGLHPPDFSGYLKYYVLVPEEFSGIIRMLNIKFIELFGRNIARDIETFEYSKHATTVVPAERELFISFGHENKVWGTDRFHIPLPEKAGYGAMMAIGYYIVGKIQRAQPPWFQKHLPEYCQKASEVFGQEISPIV